MISCAPLSKVVIVPSNYAVTIVKKGQVVTAPEDGVLVSEGLWVEMNDELIACQGKRN
jgi:hypothetical protein